MSASFQSQSNFNDPTLPPSSSTTSSTDWAKLNNQIYQPQAGLVSNPMNQSSSGQNTNTPNPLASSPWSSVTGGGFAAPGGNYGSPFGVTAQLGAGPWTGSQQQPPTTSPLNLDLGYQDNNYQQVLTQHPNWTATKNSLSDIAQAPYTNEQGQGVNKDGTFWNIGSQQTPPTTGITGIAAPGGNYRNPTQLGGPGTGSQQSTPTTPNTNDPGQFLGIESGVVSSSGGYDKGYQQFLQNNPDWVKNNSPAGIQSPQQAYGAYQRQIPVPPPPQSGAAGRIQLENQQPPAAPVPPPSPNPFAQYGQYADRLNQEFNKQKGSYGKTEANDRYFSNPEGFMKNQADQFLNQYKINDYYAKNNPGQNPLNGSGDYWNRGIDWNTGLDNGKGGEIYSGGQLYIPQGNGTYLNVNSGKIMQQEMPQQDPDNPFGVVIGGGQRPTFKEYTPGSQPPAAPVPPNIMSNILPIGERNGYDLSGNKVWQKPMPTPGLLQSIINSGSVNGQPVPTDILQKLKDQYNQIPGNVYNPPSAPVPPPMTYNPGYGRPGVAQQHIPGRHLMPQRSPLRFVQGVDGTGMPIFTPAQQ